MKTEFVRYLERLSELYPTNRQSVYRDYQLAVNSELPKGTEHFLSDIHGEYESFSHVLRNGSGAVRKKMMMYSGIHSVQMTRVNLRHLFTIRKEKNRITIKKP